MNENRLLPTYLSLGYTLPYHVSQFHRLSFVLSPSVFFFCRRERGLVGKYTVCVSRYNPCSLFLLIQEEVQHRKCSGIEREHSVYFCTVFCEFVWIRIRLELLKLSLFASLRNRSEQIRSDQFRSDPVVNKNFGCWIVSSSGEVREVSWPT